ncbi:MAG: hypothetical protein AAB546_01905 [Patescibacteria group bacterium]
MISTLVLTIFLFIFVFAFPKVAFAHCPLCVAGAGAGLTLARLFGIDDSITGIWLAAFLGAISFWSEARIFKLLRVKSLFLKNILRPVIYIAIFGLTLVSFYQFNLVNDLYQIFGIEKLIYGMLIGGTLFYFVDVVDDFVIRKHEGVYFAYQRIIVSLGSILLASFGQYYLINYII